MSGAVRVIKRRTARISRCFRPAVTVVKAAKPGSGHDSGLRSRTAFDGSFAGSVLVQANVCSVLMVISKVVAPKPAYVILIQRNDVVEQFATCTAHPTLRHSVLPGTANTRAHWLESTGV